MLNTILLLDDNKSTNFIHRKFILKADCAKKVVVFQIGQEAIDYLRQVSNYPELIFVDINMPTMDAWEFLDHYNKITPKGNHVSKVILLTTSLSPKDKEKVKNYPTIAEVILKPLNTEMIKRIIEKYFENAESLNT